MSHLLAAEGHTRNNREEVEGSRLCGCIYCQQTFPPSEIVGWSGLDLKDFDQAATAEGGTALCPRCGSDSVIGDKSGYQITPAFLTKMHEAWFQKTIIRKPAPKA